MAPSQQCDPLRDFMIAQDVFREIMTDHAFSTAAGNGNGCSSVDEIGMPYENISGFGVEGSRFESASIQHVFQLVFIFTVGLSIQHKGVAGVAVVFIIYVRQLMGSWVIEQWPLISSIIL